MFKTFLLLVLCVGIFATGECGGLTSLFRRKTTTEQPEETTAATTVASSSKLPSDYYVSNTIPAKVDEGCYLKYTCKKKLKTAESPRPCVKFCVSYIVCNEVSEKAQPDQCLVLDEERVLQDYNNCKDDEDAAGDNGIETTTKSAAKVAMIDFPCQPGYLPDSRGRCREVW